MNQQQWHCIQTKQNSGLRNAFSESKTTQSNAKFSPRKRITTKTYPVRISWVWVRVSVCICICVLSQHFMFALTIKMSIVASVHLKHIESVRFLFTYCAISRGKGKSAGNHHSYFCHASISNRIPIEQFEWMIYYLKIDWNSDAYQSCVVDVIFLFPLRIHSIQFGFIVVFPQYYYINSEYSGKCKASCSKYWNWVFFSSLHSSCCPPSPCLSISFF